MGTNFEIANYWAFLWLKLNRIESTTTIIKIFFVYISASWLDVEALATALALIGKASIVSCFCIIFIYSSELFPTVIRTVGVGCCAFWGRVGSLLAPQILLAVNPTIIIWYQSKKAMRIKWLHLHLVYKKKFPSRISNCKWMYVLLFWNCTKKMFPLYCQYFVLYQLLTYQSIGRNQLKPCTVG